MIQFKILAKYEALKREHMAALTMAKAFEIQCKLYSMEDEHKWLKLHR